MLGHVGVILGLVLLIVLALRGWNVFVASLLSSIVVAVTNGLGVADALAVNYADAMFGFAKLFFLLFLTGAIFGRVMGNSRAAMSIADALSRLLGQERTLIVLVLASALLTYGGVNVFIVVFTLYPLGLSLLQRANIPKRLFVGAGALGGGTFTMTAMPGSPSIHNNIPAGILKTPLTAAWDLGLIASAVMLLLGLAYLEYERRKAQRRDEGFDPHPLDPLPDPSKGPVEAPHWLWASVPLAVVVVTILLPPWLVPLLGPAADSGNALDTLLRFAQAQPLFWTSLALTLGTGAALVLFRRYRDKTGHVLSRGAEDAAMPLINTAAVIGFGGVVKATAIFDAFEALMLESGLPPIISMVVAVNVFAGIVGSASGGLGIFMETLAPHYLEAGIPPEIVHRLSAIASGGLDSLPHSGAVITMLTVMRLTHKQAYKEVGILTVIVPLSALAVVCAIAMALR